MPESDTRVFAATIAGAEVLVSAHASHFVVDEDPEIMKTALTKVE